jgi:acetylxylan esterase
LEMNVRWSVARLLLAALPPLCMAAPAGAASLQPVNDWGASGVPATVSMYIYVPDNLAANPPVLVLAHYCGGTASAVFGQAQGGGVVAAADQYGFIMVVPEAANSDGSGRCWDVGTTAALTRDGGGDTDAIVQMVEYTLAQYDANADRVYVTGDSSGGMMTQALLALYPDVFKAGAAMAGVPAGCWAVSNPDGGWSGPCAGGTVTHTGEEWRDIVEAMYPGYTGHRPRVQLFHGDADDIISYQNHTEAIKEWTAVLGLSESPTSTDTVQLGTHQATRQQWENSCGYVVLDAFTSQGGDHGPSDALFLADYVIPFLGLDQTGATDPEIEQCSSGTGGTSTGGAGGMATGGAESGGFTTGGAPPTGGISAGGTAAGGTASGGTPTGGVATGGMPMSGGSATTGGAGTTGGVATGGIVSVGGTGPLTGGAPPVTVTGGSGATGGVVSGSTGGAGAVAVDITGGVSGEAANRDAGDDEGCSCRAPGGRSHSMPFGGLIGFALLALRSFGGQNARKRRAADRPR